MKDIETRRDLEILLTEFYAVVICDAEIGHHFADLDLEMHFPVIVDFWETVLFGKQVYSNNPLQIHKVLHKKSPLKSGHFRRWVEIFSQTVDKLFAGETAEKAKLRAEMIAHSLNQKINEDSFSEPGKTRIPLL